MEYKEYNFLTLTKLIIELGGIMAKIAKQIEEYKEDYNNFITKNHTRITILFD